MISFEKIAWILITVIQFVNIPLKAQEKFQTTYYEQRRTLFEKLPNTKNEIVFLGNSITDGAEWAELFQNKRIKNRGISGDVTEGVMFRLNEVTESHPAKIFLLIGINDLARGISRDTVFGNICLIATKIKEQSRKTEIYIQSILPVNPDFGKFIQHGSKTDEILWINKSLEDWCLQTGMNYVDLFPHFKLGENNFMNPLFTNDGLHLTGAGYLVWADILKPLL